MATVNNVLQAALACFLAKRLPDTHKGDYGRVLIIAGSQGMTGAAYLCAKAALHMGSGLVYLACPKGLLHTYECLVPEAVKIPVGTQEDLWFKEEHFTALAKLSLDKDAIVLGPGLGAATETQKLVRALIEDAGFGRDAKGIVIDADGLNAWKKYRPELESCASSKLILTPHEGEFARLTGVPVSEIHAHRKEQAEAFARKLSGATVLLKGAGTVCTDGTRTYINTTGNPGMATGGSGDVLAGMLAGLVATEPQEDLFTLCTYGASLHGLCGDRAAEKYGERFVTAGCLIEEMGELCHDAR